MQVKRAIHHCTTVLVGLLMATSAMAASSSPVRTDHLTSSMVASVQSVKPGQSVTVGLLLQHDPHWHTYWRNSGDSGLPTKIQLELPTGVTASEIQWPAPYRFDVEGIVNFGYGNRQLLPVTLQIGPEFPGSAVEVRASASWLICEVECIPGRAEYRLDIPVGPEDAARSDQFDDFSSALQRLPQALPGLAHFRVEGEQIEIEITSAALPGDIAAWEIFPAAAQIIRNGAYPMWTRIEGGMRMSLPLSEYYAGAPAEVPLVLVNGDRAFSITALPAARDG
jgi:thiol:disulfide interchange protein DsbD